MWAIVNGKTGLYVYGTDYRQRYANGTVRQRVSANQALTYETKGKAEFDMLDRKMSDEYKPVEVRMVVAETMT